MNAGPPPDDSERRSEQDSGQRSESRPRPLPERPRERTRRSPFALLLPLSFLCLSATYWLRRDTPAGLAPVPRVHSPDEGVDAFSGEVGDGAHGWIAVTLAPLHPSSVRQAFESRALAERMDLAEGQAWRLTAQFVAPQAPAAASARPRGRLAESGPARAEGGAQAPGVVQPVAEYALRLGAVSVRDASGTALSSLPATPAAPPGAADGPRPRSPLATLFAPPTGSLAPGESAEWVLWGRRPGAGAELTGLLGDDEAFREAFGFGGAIALSEARVRRADLHSPLARLDRGKTERRASSAPHEPERPARGAADGTGGDGH